MPPCCVRADSLPQAPGHCKPGFTAATLPLAIGLALDIYVVIAKIAESGAIGIAAAAALTLLLGLWYGYPLAALARRQRAGAAACDRTPRRPDQRNEPARASFAAG